MTIPPLQEYDSLEDWVEEVASTVGLSEETVWNIVSEIKPGAKTVANNSKSQLLRRLFKHHTLYMKNSLRQEGSPANSCSIELYTDDRLVYQFYWPTHTPIVGESQSDEVHNIIEEEGMDLAHQGADFIAAFLPRSDVDEDFRIMARILNEVHNISIDDIDRAIELRGREQFSWHDQETLAENIEEMESTSDERENGQQEDEKEIDDWLSSQGEKEKEYDDWVFCQSCGEQIEEPNENPRFCSNCRD